MHTKAKFLNKKAQKSSNLCYNKVAKQIYTQGDDFYAQ